MAARLMWAVGVVGLSCFLCAASAMPARRSPAPDLAARRRSATDRNFIRFGRSYHDPSELAEDLKQHHSRDLLDLMRPDCCGDGFVRFGRSPPLRISEDELLELVKPDQEYERYQSTKRRNNNFVRLGRRDDSFLRYGRSNSEYPGVEVNGEITLVNKEPQLKKDTFLRLGRGSMESAAGLNEMFDEEEERKKRSL